MRTREYGAMELSDELKAENPDVFHPLVRTHPADGRKALWPSTGTVTEVVDMPNPQGLDLVQELVDFITRDDRFIYRHKWREGDILMWGQPLHAAHGHALRRQDIRARDAPPVGARRQALLIVADGARGRCGTG